MEREPLPGITVCLHENNLLEMCLVLNPLEGPYLALPLHLSVCIPPSYPHEPPRISIQTPISHPNVLGPYICCDLLKPRSSVWDSDPVSAPRRRRTYLGGYTPAYLLKYLFLQLLSFFSSTHIEQEYGGFFKLHPYAVLPSSDFQCNKCPFDSSHLWHDARLHQERGHHGPSSSKHKRSIASTHDQSESGKRLEHDSNGDCVLSCIQVQVVESYEEDRLDMLNDHVWLIIFEYLSDQDLINLGTAAPSRAGDVLRRYNVSLRRELLCFFTRKTLKEAVLGVGVRLELPTRGKPSLHAEAFDLLSLEAFQIHSVREGICGEKFTHFLPLALDDHHFERAMPALNNFLRGVNNSFGRLADFLYVIPKLMNTMIVSMMKTCDADAGDILQASEKAFKGYCLLFHLLIKLSGKADLKAEAKEKLKIFLSNKHMQTKKNIPDLGEFVALLPLALEEGYDWFKLCRALVDELLTRNVLWILKDKPELAELRKHYKTDAQGKGERDLYTISTRIRLRKTYNASRTGLRLMMLQANFMRALVKCRERLSETYGFPSDAMATQLVKLVKRIYRLSEVCGDGDEECYEAWKGFFTILRFDPIPSDVEVEEMLRKAIQDSEHKGYHSNAKFRSSDYHRDTYHGSMHSDHHSSRRSSHSHSRHYY